MTPRAVHFLQAVRNRAEEPQERSALVEPQDRKRPIGPKRDSLFMRNCLSATALFLAVGFVATAGIACNKSISSGASALQSAAPEVKKGWDVAMAAMATNGYAIAIIELQKIRQSPGVTAEQGKAIDKPPPKSVTKCTQRPIRTTPRPRRRSMTCATPGSVSASNRNREFHSQARRSLWTAVLFCRPVIA